MDIRENRLSVLLYFDLLIRLHPDRLVSFSSSIFRLDLEKNNTIDNIFQFFYISTHFSLPHHNFMVAFSSSIFRRVYLCPPNRIAALSVLLYFDYNSPFAASTIRYFQFFYISTSLSSNLQGQSGSSFSSSIFRLSEIEERRSKQIFQFFYISTPQP